MENVTMTQYEMCSSSQTAKNENSASRISIRRSNYVFCGFNLKIAGFMSSEMGVSSYIWKSGLVLCQYFEKANISFTGKKVIELGSGTGIVGILAALLGGTVTMTDLPEILKQINNNIAINIPSACRHRLKVRALTWGEDHTKFDNDYDIILGSDLVYSSSSYPALVDTLRYFCRRGATVYLSSEFRNGNGSFFFHEVMLPSHFNCQIVDRSDAKYIAVYKLTKLDSEASNN